VRACGLDPAFLREKVAALLKRQEQLLAAQQRILKGQSSLYAVPPLSETASPSPSSAASLSFSMRLPPVKTRMDATFSGLTTYPSSHQIEEME